MLKLWLWIGLKIIKFQFVVVKADEEGKFVKAIFFCHEEKEAEAYTKLKNDCINCTSIKNLESKLKIAISALEQPQTEKSDILFSLKQ